MTFFIITVLLLALLETAVFVGVIKLVSELSGTEESTAPDVPRAEGQDFWHNIISYDHKKKGGDKD